MKTTCQAADDTPTEDEKISFFACLSRVIDQLEEILFITNCTSKNMQGKKKHTAVDFPEPYVNINHVFRLQGLFMAYLFYEEILFY